MPRGLKTRQHTLRDGSIRTQRLPISHAGILTLAHAAGAVLAGDVLALAVPAAVLGRGVGALAAAVLDAVGAARRPRRPRRPLPVHRRAHLPEVVQLATCNLSDLPIPIYFHFIVHKLSYLYALIEFLLSHSIPYNK